MENVLGKFGRESPKTPALKSDDHKKGMEEGEDEKERLLLLPLPSSDSIEALMEFSERGERDEKKEEEEEEDRILIQFQNCVSTPFLHPHHPHSQQGFQ